MVDIDFKQIFSILDENDEGRIELRRFFDVANNYYSDAEQLARITQALDPNNTGVINFEQFCAGIAQISSLQGLTLKEVACDLTRRSRENSLVEDSDQRSLNQDGSTTTFNEYDVENDDIFHNKPHTNTTRISTSTNNITTPKKPTNHNLNSNPNNLSSSSQLDSQFYGDEEEFTGVAEEAPSAHSSDTVYLRPAAQRLSLIKRSSYLQPVIQTEEAEQQLQETVDELEKKIKTFTEEKQTTNVRLSRIQSENIDLKGRLLLLEERLHDLEEQQTRTAHSEKQRQAEYINQKDREFLQEKEVLQSSIMRINAIESELKQTNTLNGQMKKDVKELKQKLDDVDLQLRDSQMRCNNLSEDNEKLLEQLRLQREELEAEKIANAQLAEQLAHDATHYKANRTESIIRTTTTRIEDLVAHIEQLKLENQRLTQENKELKDQAILDSVNEGRTLMSGPGVTSLAGELEVLSKEELMNKLKDQYSINDRLREYIERMLSVIIEHSPQLLEVTTSNGVSIGNMAMPSMNCQKQSSMTKINNKSVPSLNSTITKSMGADPISSSSATKQPSDKYCHL